ncbi:MAG TPA: hypothetical protein VF017_03195 [Thermoanaerobaculia bacterium]|nr:hypothetical protein [Thermoanaerobaculia bacterium]
MTASDLAELLDQLLEGERPVGRLPQLRSLVERLEQARERLHGSGEPVLGLVGPVLQEVWSLEETLVPPALAADLAAETLALLAEAALYRGCERSGELALALARLAADAGTGDPFVAAQVFGTGVLFQLNRGRFDEADEVVHHLTQAVEAGRDLRLREEANLWFELLEIERGNHARVAAGRRILGDRLPQEEVAALRVRLERRLRFADGGAPVLPAAEAIGRPRPGRPGPTRACPG